MYFFQEGREQRLIGQQIDVVPIADMLSDLLFAGGLDPVGCRGIINTGVSIGVFGGAVHLRICAEIS